MIVDELDLSFVSEEVHCSSLPILTSLRMGAARQKHVLGSSVGNGSVTVRAY